MAARNENEDQYDEGDKAYEGTFLTRNQLRKIRVFISSKCGDRGRFDSMRRELASLVDSVPAFQAYLWERSGASTEQAGARYIAELDDCDVVVFIIDNKDGVTQGVQKEIERARQTNKRSFYYFCSELSDTETPLQRQLIGAGGPTYKVVQKMEDIPRQAVDDLTEDVFTRYREWCNHSIVSLDEQQDALAHQLRIVDSLQLPKESIASFPKLSSVIQSFLFGKPAEDVQASGEYDYEVARLATLLYVEVDAKSFDPNGLIESINSLLPDEYISVIRKRWRGVLFSFDGDRYSALHYLETAYEMAVKSHLEPWFIDDILIDLRNLQSGIDGLTVRNNKYQKLLSSSDHDVSYPLLDRALYQAMESIEKNRYTAKTKSYGTVEYGSNIKGLLEPVCKAFAIAAAFGSLTYIALTAHRLKNLVFYLCSKYKDARLNTTLLQLSIITGGQGDGEKTAQAFNDLSFDDDSRAAQNVFTFCAQYRCLNDRSWTLFEAFGLVGCYMDDIGFIRAEAKFIEQSEKCLAEIDPWETAPAAIFGAMRNNVRRLNEVWMIDYTIRSVGVDQFHWSRRALRFIPNLISSRPALDDAQLDKILEAVKTLIGKTGDAVVKNEACDSLVALGGILPVRWHAMLQTLADVLPENLKSKFTKLSPWSVAEGDRISIVNDAIKAIEHKNKTQGARGQYSFGDNIHARAFALLREAGEAPQSLRQELATACLGTLQCQNFDFSGKIQACETLCNMLNSYDKVFKSVVSARELLSDKAALMQGFSLRDDDSSLLDVWIDVTALLAGCTAVEDLYISLARCHQKSEYVRAKTGDALKHLCARGALKVPDSLQGYLFSYACYLSQADHFQLNIRGLEILSEFLSRAEFREPAAKLLFDLYSGQSPRGKKTIIDTIPVIKQFDADLAEEMRNKILRDSTYNAVAHLRDLEQEGDK